MNNFWDIKKIINIFRKFRNISGLSLVMFFFFNQVDSI